MRTAVAAVRWGWAFAADRLADYVELTKPRIAVLVLVVVAVASLAAGRGAANPAVVCHAVLGTALVAAGASVFNQLLERESDGRMRRTAMRPLPAGRVSAASAVALGSSLTAIGMVELAALINVPTAGWALLSSVLYVLAYTPLKRFTTLNTIVGAIPGALPAVIGWSAVNPRLGWEAFALFLIVFLWQFPHFLAIAWLYRDDYARAGLRMLPISELGRKTVGLQAVSYLLALVPISLLPAMLGLAGSAYFCGGLVLGVQFLYYAVRFALDRTDERARLLLWASLVYLPALLALLAFDLNRMGS